MKKLLIILIGIFLFSYTPPKQTPELTKENLWQEILKADIKYPDLVFGQAILETGHFKSENCRVNNNLFGMKLPRVRKTIATPGSKGYARYRNWVESVYDYKLFQEYLFSRKDYTRAQYISMLDRTYSEGAHYARIVQDLVRRHDYIISVPYLNPRIDTVLYVDADSIPAPDTLLIVDSNL